MNVVRIRRQSRERHSRRQSRERHDTRWRQSRERHHLAWRFIRGSTHLEISHTRINAHTRIRTGVSRRRRAWRTDALTIAPWQVASTFVSMSGFHLYFNVCWCLFQYLLVFMSVLIERSFTRFDIFVLHVTRFDTFVLHVIRFDTFVLHVSFEVLFKDIQPHLRHTYSLTYVTHCLTYPMP